MSHSPSHPCRQRGLTLIETSVALAMIAVIASLATPSMRSLIDNRRLDAAATRLGTDLQLARIESVARNAGVRVSFQAGVGAGCWIVHTGAAADCRCEADGTARCTGGAEPIKAVMLREAERISLGASSASMLFDPVLGTVTPTGTWRITAPDGRAVHQIVNLTGRVRTCSPGGAVPGHRAC